jgi:follistatin
MLIGRSNYARRRCLEQTRRPNANTHSCVPRSLNKRCFPFDLIFFILCRAGGLCWESMERNGKCKELTAQHVTKEECCSANQPAAAAWSPDDLDPGALFFWRVLGDGVSCTGCRGELIIPRQSLTVFHRGRRVVSETCDGMQCGPGRRCTLRKGRPRCVCAPQCGSGSARPGPVCGTDGRSYRSLCRLRKRACRRRTRDLTLNYYGHCQSESSFQSLGNNSNYSK